MQNTKFILSLIIVIMMLTSCSFVTKLKEKLSSGKKEDVTSTEDSKEDMRESTSDEDMNFYNKYIEVMNKIQDAGEHVYRDYNSSIPEPSSITKNSLIIPITLSISVQTLERTIKEYKRSYFDGGPLSKLHAAGEMKNEIEADFTNLITAMEGFYPVAQKVSDYYSKYEYKKDLSHVHEYDDEMKVSYEKYKAAYDKFSGILKKYKPKRDVRDPSSISDPNERSSTVMLNAYGNILDGAENFFESFKEVEFKGDLSSAKNSLIEFEKIVIDNKRDVLNAEFTDRTKYMKYNFEDYFLKTADKFIESGKDFFEEGSTKNESEYKLKYNEVVDSYNGMINSYNTSINSINSTRSW
ncbi:MAG: DUF3829 domain-containing protein [Ignavibacteria bacterium]